MRQMLLYEGLYPDIEEKANTRRTATYLAVGARIRAYKKFLAGFTNNKKPSDEVLHDHPDAGFTSSTQKDYHSIQSFLAHFLRKLSNPVI